MMSSRASVVTVAVLALLSACDRRQEPPAQPVQQPVAAPRTPSAPPVGYACESGKTVTLQYPDTSTAQLTYQGQTYVMRTVPAASGARYAGSGMEWWTATTVGQEQATLSRLGPNQDVGVAVLERCSRPSTNGAAPVGPAAPAIPPTAPGGVLPAGAPCRGPQLKLSTEGGDAAMGHRVTTLGLQNTGPTPCTVTGYPTVSLLDGRGRSLTAIRSDQTPGSYFRQGTAPTSVTLAPQAKAYFDLAWTVVPHEGMGERVCPTAASVRVAAPGDATVLSLPMTFTPCGGRIEVGPLRPVAEPIAPGLGT